MGAAFARRLAAADHEVAIATQGLDQARKVASEVGYRVPREELAEGTDLLILADAVWRAGRRTACGAPHGRQDGDRYQQSAHPRHVGARGWPHHLGRRGDPARGARGESREGVQYRVLGGTGVRAWRDSKVQVFYAGDDAGAKDIVRRLAESIGFEPVDGGPLATWSRSACSTSGSATWAAGARTSRRGGTPPRQLSLWPSKATYSRGGLAPYFPSIIMLPSMSLSEP